MAENWYADNMRLLIVISTIGLLFASLIHLPLVYVIRRRYHQRKLRLQFESPDIVILRAQLYVAQGIVTVLMILQIHLLFMTVGNARNIRTAEAYLFSVYRPMCNVCSLYVGFKISYRALYRNLFLIACSHIVVTDCLSELTCSLLIACIRSRGISCSKSVVGPELSTFSLRELHTLQLRDLASFLLGIWVIFGTAQISTRLGFFGSKFTHLQLSTATKESIKDRLVRYYPSEMTRELNLIHRSAT